MVTLWLLSNSPLVNLIVPCSPGAKAMVLSPERMAARSEPAPWSNRLVTVLGTVRSSSTSKRSRTERRQRVGFDPRRRGRVGEPVVNRRNQDANNMMQAFLEENRSAGKISCPRRADPLPGLAASIPFTVHGFAASGNLEKQTSGG